MMRQSIQLNHFTLLVLVGLLCLALPATMADAATADHLIISEVVTKTRVITGGRLGSEFIEVVNPTVSDIDLSDVFLSDATYATGGILYWEIASGAHDMAAIGGGLYSDFHARFPSGYILAAGDTLSISINGSEQYFEAYGQLPDLELYEDGFVPDVVPEMRAVFPGSIHRGDPLRETDSALLPTLSDISESLILYSWDGSSDLVSDVDFMYWGTSTDVLFDKTGVTVGASTYFADTPPASQQPVSPVPENFGQALARLSADEGTETISGGNGLTGHDETSENLGVTWQIAAVQDPPQAPLVHFRTSPVFLAGGSLPAAPLAGEDVEVSVEIVSASAITAVDFRYAIDGGSEVVLVGSNVGVDTWAATIPGQQEAAVVTWYAVASNADGGVATWPAAAPAYRDGWTVGEIPDPADYPAKLLITEVCTIGTDQEFVEIWNPGTEAVDMSQYFLTDAIYSPGNQVYWRIAEGAPSAATIGGGAFADFHAQFPDSFMIAGGDTIVISIAGSAQYFDAFGFLPHLELYEADPFADLVPDMRWVFGDETNNSIINRTGSNPSIPTFTNGAETVVLYHWDGVSDGVTDIDVFNWKDPFSTTTSFLFSKTGVVVGAHAYLPDTPVASQMLFPEGANFGDSYQRIDEFEGNQLTTGSNGVLGRDETSEDLAATFVLALADPARGSGVVFPPEGDWQIAGSGSLIAYSSAAHSWGDFDHDGIDDLFLLHPAVGTQDVLLHNATMFGAQNVEEFGTSSTPGATDCVRGDYNQDGDLDIYIPVGDGGDWLYSNFGQEWSYSLVAFPVGEGGIIATTGAEMVDTDLDGWLEVFVTNGDGTNQLLDGRFGLNNMMPHSLVHPAGTIGGAWCDLDGDRDPDLGFVSGAGGFVISSQYDTRRFSETSLPSAVAGQDCAWADYDNDGDFDFILVCLGSDNVLYDNQGAGVFNQIPFVNSTGDSTSGCAWVDFNNDGRLDLYETNLNGPNVMWRNDGDSMWAVVDDTLLGAASRDRAVSWLDIDQDGDLDLYASSFGIPNRLVRNNLDNSKQWLQVSVAGHHWGNQSNFDAIGALIEVEASGKVQRRYVGGGEAGRGHSPFVQHFGLGAATLVDRVTVFWPFRLPNGSFHQTVQRDVAVNQRLDIEETIYGVSAVDLVPGLKNELKGAQPNPFNPATVIAYTLARGAVVELDVFDVRGRRVARLVDGVSTEAGRHKVTWRGKTDAGADAPSGVYIYRLSAGGFVASQRMVLIR